MRTPVTGSKVFVATPLCPGSSATVQGTAPPDEKTDDPGRSAASAVADPTVMAAVTTPAVILRKLMASRIPVTDVNRVTEVNDRDLDSPESPATPAPTP